VLFVVAEDTYGLGLLVEDGLGLTTVTGLLTVVTTLSLGGERVLALLVLGHLVRGVLLASLSPAVRATSPGKMLVKLVHGSVFRIPTTGMTRDGP